MSASLFAGSPRCAFILTRNVAAPAVVLSRISSEVWWLPVECLRLALVLTSLFRLSLTVFLQLLAALGCRTNKVWFLSLDYRVMKRQRLLVPHGSSWILLLRVPPFSAAFYCFSADSHDLLPFPPLFGQIHHPLWMCLRSRGLLIYWSLCPSSIPARYLSVVFDIRSCRLMPSMLSTTPDFFLSWHCEPSMKRDSPSIPFWCCLQVASTMTCIVCSACNVHSSCSRCFLFQFCFIRKRESLLPWQDSHQ